MKEYNGTGELTEAFLRSHLGFQPTPQVPYSTVSSLIYNCVLGFNKYVPYVDCGPSDITPQRDFSFLCRKAFLAAVFRTLLLSSVARKSRFVFLNVMAFYYIVTFLYLRFNPDQGGILFSDTTFSKTVFKQCCFKNFFVEIPC